MPKKLFVTKKYKVFFIDDHKPLVSLYSMKFQQEGFEVGSCTEAPRIMEQVKAFKPDLIFLDLVMGIMDGLEVLKRLKSTLETKWIPVVMFSNIDNARDKEQCLKWGASHFLVKVQFSPSDLVAYARKVLEMG